jgi:hypothetical protein
MQLYGSQEEKLKVNEHLGISAREFLQKFGTEICREILPKTIPNMDLGESCNIWIKLFELFLTNLRTANIIKKCNTLLVISDVRFPDEVKSIKNQGGILIRLTRNMYKTGYEHKHTSETSMNDIKYDLCINNNGNKDILYKTLIDIFNL